MKKSLFLAAAALALAACNSTNDPISGGGGTSGGGSASGGDAGEGEYLEFASDLQTFTIATDETPLSNEGDEECDDKYNASSLTTTETVNIAYSESGVSVDGNTVAAGSSTKTTNGNEISVADGNVVEVSCNNSANYVLTSNGSSVTGTFTLKKNTMGNIVTMNNLCLKNSAKCIVTKKAGTMFLVVNGTNSIDTSESTKKGIESDGDIVISGEGKLNITAGGSGITSEEGCAYLHKSTILNIEGGADKHGISTATGITIAGGVQNITVKGGSYDEEAAEANTPKGIKSDGTIKFLGGRTTVINNGTAIYEVSTSDYSAAACVKADDIVIDGGTVLCKATGNGGKGIRADNNLTIASGTVRVITEGKNLANNDGREYSSSDSYSDSYVDANPKAIHVGDKDADPITGNLTIYGGDIKVRAMYSEGIESKKDITVNDGMIQVYATDDAINAGVSEKANGSIVINGGTIYAYGASNDGMDSNGTITINGGTVFSSGTTSPEEGIDCDQNTFKITGGTIIGLGGSTSTPTSNVCTQPSLITTATISNGAIITLAINNTDVVSFKCPRAYNGATILISGDGSSQGNTYKLYCGSTTLSSGTLSSMVNGSTGGGGGGGVQPTPGGGGGGRPF